MPGAQSRQRWALCAALVLVGTPARAALPVVDQARLLFRTLAYDRSLKPRPGDDVVIALVARARDGASLLERDRVAEAVRALASNSRVAGAQVRVELVAYEGVAFERALASTHATVVYLCAGLDGALADISRVTRNHSVLTVTGTEPYVGAGAAIGLVQRRGRGMLLLDLAAVHDEGSVLEAGLLRFAELVKTP